jgi:hypothetical protein
MKKTVAVAVGSLTGDTTGSCVCLWVCVAVCVVCCYRMREDSYYVCKCTCLSKHKERVRGRLSKGEKANREVESTRDIRERHNDLESYVDWRTSPWDRTKSCRSSRPLLQRWLRSPIPLTRRCIFGMASMFYEKDAFKLLEMLCVEVRKTPRSMLNTRQSVKNLWQVSKVSAKDILALPRLRKW